MTDNIERLRECSSPSDGEAMQEAVDEIERLRRAPNRRAIDKDSLEAIIDIHGLPDVVLMLSEICALKAEHVNFYWQDDKLTKKWHRAGFQLFKLAADLPKIAT
jgi:hypothetical protein